MNRDGILHGMAGWFHCIFDGPKEQKNSFIKVIYIFDKTNKKVELPTGPSTKPTHWRQTLFLFEKPIVVKKDEVLDCTIECKKMSGNERGLIVRLIYSINSVFYSQEFILS